MDRCVGPRGATIFYVLFARSRLLPRPLIALGLIAAPLALASEMLVVLGVDVPLYLFLPNLPFELGAGLWLVIRGWRSSGPAGDAVDESGAPERPVGARP